MWSRWCVCAGSQAGGEDLSSCEDLADRKMVSGHVGGKTIKTSMFIKKKATSSAFQALITQHNFAVGSSGIKQVFLMLISLNLQHIIKTKSIKNEGSVCTNIVKNSYLSFFKNKL